MATRTLVLVLVACVGCAARLPLVRVDPGAALESLAGEWHGGYSGPHSSGAVLFRLVAGEDAATGDVLMTPAGAQAAYLPPGEHVAANARETSQPLAIAFVRADDAHVTGSLAPYWDPARDCEARATFTGQLEGDRLRGTFVSLCVDGGPTVSGRWWADRRVWRDDSGSPGRREG